MNKHPNQTIKHMRYYFMRFNLVGFLFFFTCVSVIAQSSVTLTPTEDAFVRNGTYAGTNFGSDVSLLVKGTTTSGFARVSYLKFQLSSVSDVVSAKLRVYGSNTENTTTVSMSAFGTGDSWTEGGITWNNAPAASTTALSSVGVNNVIKYYELDVTNYVKTEFGGDKVVSFLLKDATNQVKTLTFNSSENTANKPQLVITYDDGSSDNTTTDNVTVAPAADAFVRNGTYAGTNFGSDVTLQIKGSSSSGYTRVSYLKFPLSSVSAVVSAKLRIYGKNLENTSTINITAFGVSTDGWTESGITWNNAPAASTSALGSAGVNGVAQYYELDVTNFVQSEFSGDKVASILVKDAANQNRHMSFNSRENSANKPQLVITTSGTTPPPPPPSGDALLFIENLDKFPANDHFVACRIQNPWTRDTQEPFRYNANHDTARIRIHNKGIDPLVISNFTLSNTATWKFLKLNGVAYSSTALPLTINSGAFADLQLQFIAINQATRVKVLLDNLTITSNDSKFPSKILYLHGLYQRYGEGSREPTAQEIINAFGYKTSTGFSSKDPDLGNPSKLKGDEILSPYFVRADASKPITVRQMGAYHNCCTQTETFRWHNKGSTTLTALFTHIGLDAQSLLPRKGLPNTPAEGSFSPTGAFGFRIGSKDWSDPTKNPEGKIGVRVWKAKDANGRIIPNTYIVSNDYLGTQFTNYDYNDNTYYVTNIRPEVGTAYYSLLSATPSAVDFGEKLLQSSNSFTLNLKSLGQTYANGSSDPAITITSVVLEGENKSEFTASLPASTTLGPQATTTLNVGFKPTSQGLKIADLLIYYNTSHVPLRVPLYGIGKESGTTVSVPFRIKSGSSSSVTVNGKTWVSDVPYAFDNLEPYTNSQVTQISSTDEDVLYLREQSSNGDKKPFRYEIPITNGSYVVRLHFAEIFWGNTGNGLNGGPGSRVMSVSLEGQLELINLDVAQEVGSASALIKNIPVTVSDGKLNINFSATVNRPMVCAVEVYKFSSSAAITEANSEAFDISNEIEKPKVYPNPARDRLRIEFPGTYEGNVTLELSDQIGRTYKIGVSKVNAGGSTIDVNLSRFNLKPGLYYLKVYSDQGNAGVFKLLLE